MAAWLVPRREAVALDRRQREALEALAWLAAGGSTDARARAETALAWAAAVLPCDLALAQAAHGPRSTWIEPPGAIDPRHLAAFEACAGEYPLAAHTRGGGDGRPLRRSDVMATACYRRNAAYAEVFGPLGIDHQLVMAVPARAGAWCVAFNRSGADFSDAEVAVAALVRPLLAAALARSDAAGAGAAPEPAGLAPLTARERAVLDQVRTGASNKQIARALGMAPRTVQKHLEHIYRKLGVGNRTAAARAAAQQPSSPAQRPAA